MKVLKMNRLLFVPVMIATLGSSGLASAQNATARIDIDASRIENTIPATLYGSCMEDVNHEIYGGLYNQRIFGESFEEPAGSPDLVGFSRYDGYWTAKKGILHVDRCGGAKLVFDEAVVSDGYIETEIKFDNAKGVNAGILVRVSEPATGGHSFNGYEISIGNNGKSCLLGKLRHNFEMLKEAKADFDPLKWNKLAVRTTGSRIEVMINGKTVIDYDDVVNPILSGNPGIRIWDSDTSYRNFFYEINGQKTAIPFEAVPSPMVSSMWDAIETGSAKASFAQDTKQAYNSKCSQIIQKKFGTGQVGIANRGLNKWGIGIKQGQKYTGDLYLKGAYNGMVKVALQSADGSKEYAVCDLTGITNKWQRFSFDLIADATDTNARFALYMEGNGKLWVDQVTLMGTGSDLFHGLPFRNDIGQAMVDQGLTFLRYGGSMVNVPDYKFKNMIGDRAKRPQYKGNWYPYSTNGFGIEEFLQFCEAAGFVPSFAVNVGETAQDMADMIEYLNGPVTSEWGKKRAEAGHPEPYNVKYIEIGNEEVIWGDIRKDYEKYIQDFNRIYDAIKSKDPNVEFISAAWWRPDSPENMKMVFDALDGKASYWDYHPWADDNHLGSHVEGELREMKDYFLKWNPATKMKCALFEENGLTHDMRRALGHVTIQNAARRMGDFMLTTCAANALEPYMQNDNGWNQGQIFFTPSLVWGMPPFYAKQMAAGHHKPFRVFTATEGDLDVTAATDEWKNEVVVHVSNVHDRTIKTAINLKGFENPSKIKVISLAGDKKEKNTPEQPERIVPQEKMLYHTNDLKYEFPANSYTILIYQK